LGERRELEKAVCNCTLIGWNEGLIGQGVLAENFGLGGIMMGCIIGFTFAIQLDVSITLEEVVQYKNILEYA
jgi:hypothetical protein